MDISFLRVFSLEDIFHFLLIFVLSGAALQDFFSRKIWNIFPISLLILGIFFWIFSLFLGRDFVLINFFLHFFMMGIFSFFLWYMGIWGGGDAKVLMGLSLFFPLGSFFDLLIWIFLWGGVLGIFYGVYFCVRKNYRRYDNRTFEESVPYGIAIFCGTFCFVFWGDFMGIMGG